MRTYEDLKLVYGKSLNFRFIKALSLAVLVRSPNHALPPELPWFFVLPRQQYLVLNV